MDNQFAPKQNQESENLDELHEKANQANKDFDEASQTVNDTEGSFKKTNDRLGEVPGSTLKKKQEELKDNQENFKDWQEEQRDRKVAEEKLDHIRESGADFFDESRYESLNDLPSDIDMKMVEDNINWLVEGNRLKDAIYLFKKFSQETAEYDHTQSQRETRRNTAEVFQRSVVNKALENDQINIAHEVLELFENMMDNEQTDPRIRTRYKTSIRNTKIQIADYLLQKKSAQNAFQYISSIDFDIENYMPSTILKKSSRKHFNYKSETSNNLKLRAAKRLFDEGGQADKNLAVGSLNELAKYHRSNFVEILSILKEKNISMYEAVMGRIKYRPYDRFQIKDALDQVNFFKVEKKKTDNLKQTQELKDLWMELNTPSSEDEDEARNSVDNLETRAQDIEKELDSAREKLNEIRSKYRKKRRQAEQEFKNL